MSDSEKYRTRERERERERKRKRDKGCKILYICVSIRIGGFLDQSLAGRWELVDYVKWF